MQHAVLVIVVVVLLVVAQETSFGSVVTLSVCPSV